MKPQEIRNIFLTTFLFVVAAGLLLQLVLLPLTPWHAGCGLLFGGDWVWFHQLAEQLADSIKQSGWGSFTLRFQGQAPAGVAGVLYAITGIERPLILLPLHGFLYAIATLALYSTARSLGAGHRRAWLCILPLFLFPSTAMIWGQIHKDIYSLPGVLLILRFWVQVYKLTISLAAPRIIIISRELMFLALGMALIILVRPYLGPVLAAAGLVPAVTMSARYLFIKLSRHRNEITTNNRWYGPGMVLAGVALQLIMVASMDTIDTDRQVYHDTWSSCRFLPATFNRQLAGLAKTRDGFRRGYPGAGSNIDTDIGFSELSDIVKYTPRAMQIALFSPFPNQWLADDSRHKSRIMRLLVVPEMLVLYFTLPGIAVAIFYRRIRTPALMTLAMSLVVIVAYVLAVPNVGCLYRMRYPMMLVLIVIGSNGWFELMQTHKWLPVSIFRKQPDSARQ